MAAAGWWRVGTRPVLPIRERVHPRHARESSKIGVGGVDGQAMFERQCGQLGVGDEAGADGLVSGQAQQHRGRAFGGRNPDRVGGEPSGDVLPCGGALMRPSFSRSLGVGHLVIPILSLPLVWLTDDYTNRR